MVFLTWILAGRKYRNAEGRSVLEIKLFGMNARFILFGGDRLLEAALQDPYEAGEAG